VLREISGLPGNVYEHCGLRFADSYDSFEETSVSIYLEEEAQGSVETFSPSTKLHAVTFKKTAEREVQTDGQTQHRDLVKSFFAMQLAM
jgi:hypothetical protein